MHCIRMGPCTVCSVHMPAPAPALCLLCDVYIKNKPVSYKSSRGVRSAYMARMFLAFVRQMEWYVWHSSGRRVALLSDTSVAHDCLNVSCMFGMYYTTKIFDEIYDIHLYQIWEEPNVGSHKIFLY